VFRNVLIFFTLSLLIPINLHAKLNIVASFSILKDMVGNIGGDKVNVVSIVGVDADAHTYSPTAQDTVKISKADLVFLNGFGFEGSISKLIGTNNSRVIIATQGVDSIRSSTGEIDPHAWHDPRNGLIYYKNILIALDKALPQDHEYFEERYRKEIKRIEALYRDNKKKLIKNNIRFFVILTSHDAFEYFGKAYGVKFMAPQSVSTESEPSAKDVAKIIEEIKQKKVKKIFLENMSDPRNLEMITKDTGLKLNGSLCADALTLPNRDCGTYYEMLKSNFNKIFDY